MHQHNAHLRRYLIRERMDRGPPSLSRRGRKSAPVKNAVFIGAQNKGRSSTRRNMSDRFPSEQSVPGNTPLRETSYKNERSRSRMDTRSHMRMSTPVRNSDQSPRYNTRYQTSRGSQSGRDSVSSCSSRRYHPDYDPYIELRRAKERLDQYQTKDSWKTDMILSDDANEDLRRYEAKIRRRMAEKGESDENVELERREIVLLRRQRDIDMGKVTERYAQYVLSTPKPEREKFMPRTPNKFRKVSRRAWDGMIRKWRKHLHNFDDLNFEESWRSLSSSVDQSSTSGNSDNEGSVISSTADLPTYRPVPIKLEEDEESTLQARPKAVLGRHPMQRRSRQSSGQQGGGDDNDTLSALPTIGSGSGNRSSTRSGPSADVLHSGLTNDMVNLSHHSHHGHARKRDASGQQARKPFVDLGNQVDFPSLPNAAEESPSSPRKRVRRGILSQSGVDLHSKF